MIAGTGRDDPDHAPDEDSDADTASGGAPEEPGES